jgi:hypothetical protein
VSVYFVVVARFMDADERKNHRVDDYGPDLVSKVNSVGCTGGVHGERRWEASKLDIKYYLDQGRAIESKSDANASRKSDL